MEKKKIDPESRDYDLKDIEVDARFKQTTKEFFITMVVYVVFAALLIANLYLVGGSDVSNYTYVFGFPLWIFLEIIILIGFVVAVVLVATFCYKDMDITPEGKIHEKHKKKGEA